MCMDNLITELGFMVLGGILAAIPVYILGSILNGQSND